MPKWIKWCLRISIVLLAVGIVLSAIGFWINKGKGFNIYWKDYRFVYDKDESAISELDFTELDAFEEINVDIDSADVQFKQGDDYGISYRVEGDAPTYSVENGVLTVNKSQDSIAVVNFNFNFISQERSNIITIYYPAGEDVSFTSINLTNHFGDINVTGDFEADNLDIVNDSGDVYLTGLSGAMIVELNFGDLTIEDSTFESLDIDNQSGDCTMDNVEIAGNTSISNEFGNSEASNCSFNEITANMECGDLDFINCVYSANVNIEESFGDVSVEGECTTDSFGFDLDASFGDISVQGNSIDQSSYSENSDADIVFTVSNESGDTSVEIA